MQLASVRCVQVPLRLVSPLRTSTGTHDERTALLVQVTTDDVSVGWGEDVAPTGDFYTGETAAASLAALRGELTAALGGEFASPVGLDESWWGTHRWPMARAAVESAVWDAWCRSRGESLAVALGGRPGRVEVACVVGLHDQVAATVAEAMARVDEGYKHLKLKIAPGRDVDIVREVRSAVGGSVTISVDGNGAFTVDDMQRLVCLADHQVSLVEQPFAVGDWSAARELVATGTVSVGLDESIMSQSDLDVALARGALNAVNVKPSRLGGLAPAVVMLERCAREGLGAWIGGMLESGIGRAAALALASHPACTSAPDLSASGRYFVGDVTEPFVLVDGALEVPGGTGLGVVPTAHVLQGHEFETLWSRRVVPPLVS